MELYLYYTMNDFDIVGAINLSQAILTMDHKFSIRFKSGEFPGQSNTVIFIFLKQFVIFFALWQGAESY